MNYQRKILTEINSAVVAGEIDLESPARDHIQTCSDRATIGDETAWTDFMDHLRKHQTVAHAVGRHLVGVGYRFLDEELDRLAKIKSERPFTDEEHQYGLRALTQLLEEVTMLARKTGTPDR